MNKSNFTSKKFNLVVRDAKPIFEPCARCGKKPKWGATSAYCRECKHDYNQQYRMLHYEEMRQQKKKWIQKQRLQWRKRKQQLVELKGGKCVRCGYSENYGALIFHHPNGRKGKLSENPWNNKFNIEEVVLVCRNCHEVIHHPELQVLQVEASK